MEPTSSACVVARRTAAFDIDLACGPSRAVGTREHRSDWSAPWAKGRTLSAAGREVPPTSNGYMLGTRTGSGGTASVR